MADDIYAQSQRAWQALQAGQYPESARLFEPLAARGSEYALLTLGRMYMAGRLGPPDIDKAVSLFEKAAEGRSAVAKHHLGRALRDKGDLQRARAIFLEGAEQGYTPCMYWIGRMLVHGEGGEIDTPAGVAWLTRGAESGHVFCRRALYGLELRRAGSLFGRVWVCGKIVWYILGIVPRYWRDPYSPDFC